ncbi:hypothetical protein GXM_03928 [Nostoc sphaeroides CCNUC1]|uniref:Uncharacterized protein n=1 Tax=Nostoc sphaeroides CCNUC1 TaxID=2653204 RepID=A0A5P8W143_9NOSO|nr:hypothetical protein GXM_03928 [Nostoc sphaeroides CCNUC1]
MGGTLPHIQQEAFSNKVITKPFGQGTLKREQGTALKTCPNFGSKAPKFIYEKK